MVGVAKMGVALTPQCAWTVAPLCQDRPHPAPLSHSVSFPLHFEELASDSDKKTARIDKRGGRE
jgi:hypothetical protein